MEQTRRVSGLRGRERDALGRQRVVEEVYAHGEGEAGGG